MTKRVHLLSVLSSCSILAAASFGAQSAMAGFEWVPAGNALPPAMEKPQEVITPEPVHAMPEMTDMHVVATPSAEAPVQKMHHVAVTPELAEAPALPSEETESVVPAGPLVIEEALADVPAPVTAEAPVIEDAPVVEEEVVVYEETMPKKEYAMAYGFGKDMPLALALRQIVPATYAFSFDPAVEIGTRVSWQGGEAWNVVLKKALLTKELAATVYDDMVLIRPSTHADHAVMEAAAAPEMAAEVEASEAPAALAETHAAADEETTEAQPAYFEASHSWIAVEGQTLRSVLAEWSDKVGVELHWNNLYDYPVTNSWAFDGDYVHAVDGLLTAYEEETPKPMGRLHPNAPTGPAVLVVSVTDAR